METYQRIPAEVRSPLGFVSLVIGILGIVIGYIFVILGVTLYFDLNPTVSLTNTGSLTVVATGLGALVIGYLGWRGFMKLAY
jgi:nicotinamide riboside transporter PnuC